MRKKLSVLRDVTQFIFIYDSLSLSYILLPSHLHSLHLYILCVLHFIYNSSQGISEV